MLLIAERLVGIERALEAARLLTAFVHGFVSMEIAGAFRLGGDVDRAFRYSLDAIIAGLQATAEGGPGRAGCEWAYLAAVRVMIASIVSLAPTIEPWSADWQEGDLLGNVGSGGRTRTYDQAVNSRPLYH